MSIAKFSVLAPFRFEGNDLALGDTVDLDNQDLSTLQLIEAGVIGPFDPDLKPQSPPDYLGFFDAISQSPALGKLLEIASDPSKTYSQAANLHYTNAIAHLGSLGTEQQLNRPFTQVRQALFLGAIANLLTSIAPDPDRDEIETAINSLSEQFAVPLE
jgi:hypothetical protein